MMKSRSTGQVSSPSSKTKAKSSEESCSKEFITARDEVVETNSSPRWIFHHHTTNRISTNVD